MAQDKKMKLNAEISVHIQNVENIVKGLDSALKDVAKVSILSEDNLKKAEGHIDKLAALVLKMLSDIDKTLKEAFKIKIDIDGIGEDSIQKLKKVIEEAFSEALSKVREDIGTLISELASDFGQLAPLLDSLFAQMAVSFQNHMGESLKQFISAAAQAEKAAKVPRARGGSKSEKVSASSGGGEDPLINIISTNEKLSILSNRVTEVLNVINKDFFEASREAGTLVEEGMTRTGDMLVLGSQAILKSIRKEIKDIQEEVLESMVGSKAALDRLTSVEGYDKAQAEDMQRNITDQIDEGKRLETILKGQIDQQNRIIAIDKRILQTRAAIGEQTKSISASQDAMINSLTGGDAAAIVRPYEHIGQNIRNTLKAIVTSQGMLNRDMYNNLEEVIKLEQKREALVKPRTNEAGDIISQGVSEDSSIIKNIDAQIAAHLEVNDAIRMKVESLEAENVELGIMLSAVKSASDELKSLDLLNKASARSFAKTVGQADKLSESFQSNRKEFEALARDSKDIDRSGGLISDSAVQNSISTLNELELYRTKMFKHIKDAEQAEESQVERLRKARQDGTGEFAELLGKDGEKDNRDFDKILEARINQIRQLGQGRIEKLKKDLEDIDNLLASPEAAMLKGQVEAAKDLEKNREKIDKLSQSQQILSASYAELTSKTLTGTDALREAATQIAELDKENIKIGGSAQEMGAILEHTFSKAGAASNLYKDQSLEALEIHKKLGEAGAASFAVGGEDGSQMSQQRLVELVALLDKTEDQYNKNSQAIESVTMRHADLNAAMKLSGNTDEYSIEQMKKLRSEISTMITELVKAEAGFKSLENAGVTLSKGHQDQMSSIRGMISNLSGMRSALDTSVSSFKALDSAKNNLQGFKEELDFIRHEFGRVGLATLNSSEDIVKFAHVINKSEGSLESLRDKLVRAKHEAIVMSDAGVEGAEEMYVAFDKLLKKTDELNKPMTIKPEKGESADFGNITRIAKDLNKVGTDFLKLKKDVDETTRSQELFNKQLSGTAQEKYLASEGLLRLGASSKTASNNIVGMISTLEEARRVTGSLSQEDEGRLTKLHSMKNALDGVTTSIKGQEPVLKRNIKDTQDSTKGFADYSAQLGDSIIRNFRFAQSAAVIASVVMGLRNAFREMLQESKAFARTLTVMRSDSMNLQQIYSTLRDTIRDTAIEFGQSTSDVLEVVKQFGSAGLSAEESMSGLNSAMKLIITTQANAESVTRSLAGIYNVFGSEIAAVSGESKVFTTIVDVLTSAYRNHQVELDEMTQGLRFAAATGKLAGFSFQDISAMLAVLNDNLIKSGTAGRGLQVVFAQLAAKSDQIAESLGFQIDPNLTVQEQFMDLLEHTNKLIGEGAISTENLDAQFKIFGLRGARSFATLAQNFESVKKAMVELNEEAEGVSDQLTNIVKNEVFTQWEVAKQALMEIGRDALEPMKETIVVLTSAIRAFSRMLKETEIGPFLNIIMFTVFILGTFITTVMGVSRVINGLVLVMAGWKTSLSVTTKGVAGLNAATATSIWSIKGMTFALYSMAGASKIAAGAITLVRSAIALLGGPIGIIITALGILATYFYHTKDSMEAIDRDLGEIISSIRELEDSSKRVKKFEDSFESIRKQMAGAATDAQVMGQRIRDAFVEAGDSAISYSLIAGKSNTELANGFDELSEKTKFLVEARKQYLAQEIEIQRKSAYDTALRQVDLLAEKVADVPNIDIGLDGFGASIDSDAQDSLNKISASIKKMFEDLAPSLGGVDEIYKAIDDRLTVNLKKLDEDHEKRMQRLRRRKKISPTSVTSMDTIAEISRYRKEVEKESKRISSAQKLLVNVFNEVRDATSNIGFKRVPLQEFTDVAESTRNRFSSLIDLLGGPVDQVFFDSMIESSAILNKEMLQLGKVIDSTVDAVISATSQGMTFDEVDLKFNPVVSMPDSAIEEIANNVAQAFGTGNMDAAIGFMVAELDDGVEHLSNMTSMTEDNTVIFRRLLGLYIAANSEVRDMSNATGETHVNMADMVGAVSILADRSAIPRDNFKDLGEIFKEVGKNATSTSRVLRHLASSSKEFSENMRKSVDSQKALNPVTKEILSLAAMRQKFNAQEATSDRSLLALQNKKLALLHEEEVLKSAVRDGEDGAEDKAREKNKELLDATKEYYEHYDSLVKIQMKQREITDGFAKSNIEQSKLNRQYKQALSLTRSEVGQQIQKIALNKHEIKDQIKLFKISESLMGSEAERIDALNKLIELKIELVELAVQIEEAWYSQNQTILETLDIFEQIKGVGDDYVTQTFKILSHANELNRIKHRVKVNDEAIAKITQQAIVDQKELQVLEAERFKLSNEFAKEYYSLIKLNQDLAGQIDKVTSNFESMLNKILDYSARLRGELTDTTKEMKELGKSLILEEGIGLEVLPSVARAFSREIGGASKAIGIFMGTDVEAKAKEIDRMFKILSEGGVYLDGIKDIGLRVLFENIQESSSRAAKSFLADFKDMNNAAQGLQASIEEGFSGSKNFQQLNQMTASFSSLVARMKAVPEGVLSNEKVRSLRMATTNELETMEKSFLNRLAGLSTESNQIVLDILLKDQGEAQEAIKLFEETATKLGYELANLYINPNALKDMKKLSSIRNIESEDLFNQLMRDFFDDQHKVLDDLLGKNAPVLKAMEELNSKGIFSDKNKEYERIAFEKAAHAAEMFEKAMNSATESFAYSLEMLSVKMVGIRAEEKVKEAIEFENFVKSSVLFKDNIVSSFETVYSIVGSIVSKFNQLRLGEGGESQSIELIGRQKGGPIPGYGGGDKVPAMLEKGEYVIPKEIVARHGMGLFERLRKGGSLPGFQDGGGVEIAAETAKSAKKEANRKPIEVIDQATKDELQKNMDATMMVVNSLEYQNRQAGKVADNTDVAKKAEKSFDGKSLESSISPKFNTVMMMLNDGLRVNLEEAIALGKVSSKAEWAKNIGKAIRSLDKETMKTFASFKKSVWLVNTSISMLEKGLGAMVSAVEGVGNIFKEVVDAMAGGANNNAQAVKQYLIQLDQIDTQYAAQIDTLQDGLRRNSSSYWGYINSIEDAERQRFQQHRENEKQLREQLVKTGQIIGQVFNSQAQQLMSSVDTNLSNLLGTGKSVDKDGKDVDGTGFRGLIGLQETSVLLDGLTATVWAMNSGLTDWKDVLTSSASVLGSFSLDILAMGTSMALQGLGGLIGALSDPENAQEFMDQFAGFLEDFPEAAPEFINGLVDNVGTLIEALADSFPAIVDTLVELIPDVVSSLIGLLAENLPGMIVELVSAIPGLILKLIPIIVVGLIVFLYNLIAAWLSKIGINIGKMDMPEFHNGGMIGGSGEVPIMALSGEAVLSRQAVSQLGGRNVIDEFNNGRNRFEDYKKFHEGGIVGDSARSSASDISPSSSPESNSSVTNNFNIDITVNGSASKEDVEHITDEFVEQIDKKLAKRSFDRVSHYDKLTRTEKAVLKASGFKMDSNANIGRK